RRAADRNRDADRRHQLLPRPGSRAARGGIHRRADLMATSSPGLFDGPIARQALASSFRKLDPRALLRNPVILAVEVVSARVTGQLIVDIVQGTGDVTFELQIAIWLWLTVLFANIAEALAEGRGKAQADALRKTRTTTMARQLVDGREVSTPAPDLRR